ncbi:MAG: hypothetical protein F7C38_02785 [Desulfurococcales archaeon]|nr:hypothetical protein [Desulfurococcales archaeon]
MSFSRHERFGVRRATIEVDEETIQKVYKTFLFILASKKLAKLLDEEDAKELANTIEETLWKRLRS